eukprot:2742749-Amphidinium_carterae.1
MREEGGEEEPQEFDDEEEEEGRKEGRKKERKKERRKKKKKKAQEAVLVLVSLLKQGKNLGTGWLLEHYVAMEYSPPPGFQGKAGPSQGAASELVCRRQPTQAAPTQGTGLDLSHMPKGQLAVACYMQSVWVQPLFKIPLRRAALTQQTQQWWCKAHPDEPAATELTCSSQNRREHARTDTQAMERQGLQVQDPEQSGLLAQGAG